jgi:hypothetical protein
VPLGDRVLPPRRSALPPEPGSCRYASWGQGLNTVGYGGKSLQLWGTVPDVHFSKILIRPFIFRKSRQNKYKKEFKREAGKNIYHFSLKILIGNVSSLWKRITSISIDRKLYLEVNLVFKAN